MIVNLPPEVLGAIQLGSFVTWLCMIGLGAWIMRHDCVCEKHCGSQHDDDARP